MSVDLLTERNIQRFIQLAELNDCPVSDAMQWRSDEYLTSLTFRDGRMHISQCLLLRWLEGELLRQALNRWQPARFAGIPQRIFHLRCGMAISCCPMAGSTAEVWLWLHRRQRHFLETLCKPS